MGRLTNGGSKKVFLDQIVVFDRSLALVTTLTVLTVGHSNASSCFLTGAIVEDPRATGEKGDRSNNRLAATRLAGWFSQHSELQATWIPVLLCLVEFDPYPTRITLHSLYFDLGTRPSPTSAQVKAMAEKSIEAE
jgi:hypothetical protein